MLCTVPTNLNLASWPRSAGSAPEKYLKDREQAQKTRLHTSYTTWLGTIGFTAKLVADTGSVTVCYKDLNAVSILQNKFLHHDKWKKTHQTFNYAREDTT